MKVQRGWEKGRAAENRLSWRLTLAGIPGTVIGILRVGIIPLVAGEAQGVVPQVEALVELMWEVLLEQAEVGRPVGAVAGKDEAVVMYCNGHNCMRSSKASAMAVGWGYSKIYYFRDGFPAWKDAGYPVE